MPDITIPGLPDGSSVTGVQFPGSDGTTTRRYTAAEIVAGGAEASGLAAGLMPAAGFTKLAGIETGADVTDAANVNAAGAVMESDFAATHTILMRQGGAGPVAVAIPFSSLMGRLSSGDIVPLTITQAKTLLAIEASEVSFDIAGTGLVGATVQAAIAELDARPSGGGEPSADLLEGFTTGNHYTATAGTLPGDDTGFLATALVEIQDVPAAVGQSLFNNYTAGVEGWQIGIESGLRPLVVVQVASGAQQALYPTVTDNPFLGMGLLLIMLRCVQDGANRVVELWLQNKFIIAGTVETGAIVPGTSTPQIGAGPFGNVAEQSGLLGVQYLAGTLTPAQIRTHFAECLAARDVVSPAGQGWTSYSVKRGSPGATWVPSDGAGPTLTRSGTLTTTSRPASRFLT